MSTRSRIGILNSDGSVKSIYCHWDGYPSNNGAILLEHYTDAKKVEELIALGDISSLGSKISTDKPHSFDDPVEDVVVAYGRDRGETDVDANINDTLESFTESMHSGEEWGYIFKDGEWLVINLCDESPSWDKLTMDYIHQHG